MTVGHGHTIRRSLLAALGAALLAPAPAPAAAPAVRMEEGIVRDLRKGPTPRRMEFGRVVEWDTDVLGLFLLETNPGAVPSGTEFRVLTGTRILLAVDPRKATKEFLGTFDDLREGMRVSVAWDGAVLEKIPPQGTASQVAIAWDQPPAAAPGGAPAADAGRTVTEEGIVRDRKEDVHRRRPELGTDVAGRFLLEQHPGAVPPGIEFVVLAGTPVLFEANPNTRPGPRPPGSFEDLREGMAVRVVYNGSVRRNIPPQGTAIRIVIRWNQPAAAAGPKAALDLSGAPLAGALEALEGKFGIEYLAKEEILAAAKPVTLEGEFTLEAAIEEIARQAGVSIRRGRDGVWTVGAAGADAAGAGPARPVLGTFLSRVAFSPDGRTLAASLPDGTIVLWDPGTGAEKRRIDGHAGAHREVGATLGAGPGIEASGDLCALVWSPDGTILGSAGRDHAIRLWNPETGAERLRIPGAHRFGITCLAFSPDGRILASGGLYHDGRTPPTGAGDERTVRLWDAATGKEQARPDTANGRHQFGVFNVVFSPNGATFVTAGNGTIKWWDAATGTERRRETSRISPVLFLPDGGGLVAVGGGGLRILDDSTGAERVRFSSPDPHAGSPVAFAASADGKVLATAGTDVEEETLPPGKIHIDIWRGKRIGHFVRFWDPATGRQTGRFPIPEEASSISLSPDGRVVAVASRSGADGIIRLWDVATGREVRRF